jgi:hypothetical protein
VTGGGLPWPTNATLTGRLLRASRVHDPAGRFANAKAFAAAFRGGCWDRTAGESQISRWETGVHQAPLEAVRRYEQLLDVPPGQLTGALHLLGRYRSSGRDGRSVLRGGPIGALEVARRRLGDLIDLIDCDGPLSGTDWDELTTLLADNPAWTIAPRRIWRRMAERLTTEMIIANGVAWQQRFESLNRLMNHRDGQQAAIAVCADLAADPANQVPIEVVSMFDATAAPEATVPILQQLRKPTNDRALYGAILACVRKIQYSHFTRDELLRLGSALRELAHDPGPDDLRRLAGHVLDRLGGRASTPAGAPAPTLLGRRMVAALGDTADGVFGGMATAMFDSPVPDVRLYSAMYLAASPYRDALARQTAAVTIAAMGTDLSTSLAGLEALGVIGGTAQRTLVERLLLAPGIPGAVTAQAARTIAHIGGRSGTSFWRSALRAHAGREDVQRSLVYALGIADQDDLLHAVQRDVAVPHRARQAAGWWVGLPRQARDWSRL